jgi:hypothetical protein
MEKRARLAAVRAHDMNQPSPGRKLVHLRQVVCSAYSRDDGLLEVVGELRDTSPDGTDLILKTIAPGGSLHDMRIVMTVDSELVIQTVSAHMAATPASYCKAVEDAYAALSGLAIGPGFRQRVKERVGGAKGCTHLTELLGPMATTAFQARSAVQRATPAWRERFEGDAPVPRPPILDTCHTYRLDGEVATMLWPEHRRAGWADRKKD